jgi:uncharacterized protein YecE (DUF72 family)
MATLYAGTSGFAYPAWKPAFYPAKLPSKQFLKHYAGRLNAVEINYTFRRLPAAATLESWVEATTPGFVFAVKANMRITHILRLKNAEQATETFLKAIDPLRTSRRLGPILFQLPPQMKADTGLLRDYLALLPGGMRYAFEFRHESWFAAPVYDVLKRRNSALCIAETDDFQTPEVLTADFAYFRLRRSQYSPAERKKIADTMASRSAEVRDVYGFFKHEENPDSPNWAREVLTAATATIGS